MRNRGNLKLTASGDREIVMTRAFVPPERLVNTEKFDEPWYPGESLITALFVEHGGNTTLTVTMRYESREARDAVLKSPMEGGVAESYDKLAELLASQEIRK